jgi:hypothetical protein
VAGSAKSSEELVPVGSFMPLRRDTQEESAQGKKGCPGDAQPDEGGGDGGEPIGRISGGAGCGQLGWETAGTENSTGMFRYAFPTEKAAASRATSCRFTVRVIQAQVTQHGRSVGRIREGGCLAEFSRSGAIGRA